MNIFRASIASMALKTSNALLVFMTMAILARTLGPDSFGLYTFAFSIISILITPAQLGMPQLIIRETAKFNAQKNQIELSSFLVGAKRVSFAILFLTLACLIGIASLPQVWPETELRNMVAPGSILIIGIALTNLYGANLIGFNKVISGQLGEVLIRPLLFLVFTAIAVAILDRMQLTAAAVLAFHAAASICALSLTVYIFKQTHEVVALDESAKPSAARPIINSLIPFSIIAGLTMINQKIDIVILGSLATTAEAGIYAVAISVAALSGFILVAMNAVLAPRFSRHYEQRETILLKRLVSAACCTFFIITTITSLALLALGPTLIEWFFGAAYIESLSPMAILLLGMVFSSAFGPVGLLLNMTGHETFTMVSAGSAALGNVVLNLTLIPVYGVVGAAIATASMMGLWKLMLWGFMYKKTCINCFVLAPSGFKAWRATR